MKKTKPKTSAARDQREPLIVSAILTYHWYDEITAGRKRTEYREITDYWTRLLWDNGRAERITAIKFNRGYTAEKMTWTVKRIDRNEGEGVYEIHLGKRID